MLAEAPALSPPAILYSGWAWGQLWEAAVVGVRSFQLFLI